MVCEAKGRSFSCLSLQEAACKLLVLLLENLVLSAKSSPELLPVSGLMVLEPVEDIFAFNFSIQGEVGSYLLNLGSIGCSDPSSIKLFQDHELLWGGAPSC